jgi:alpha-mannosidase
MAMGVSPVIDEYIRKTMEDNFKLFDKYPHYVFNFSGANRYRLMKEYFPADFARLKKYVDEGRWFPAGSSMEEGDVNAPSAEGIIRQILYGNDWFRKELGRASAEYMLPDCFGFPASLPTILAHSGVKGFSTQKLVWGSSAPGGGPESLEKTPEGTPFNVGVWVGPDGESVLAGVNPGNYSAGIYTDLSQPLPALPTNPVLEDIRKKLQPLQQAVEQAEGRGQILDAKEIQEFVDLRDQNRALTKIAEDREQSRHQGDWAARVDLNGKVSGVFTDYHYFGTGDIGGAPDEGSVKLLEAIVTKSVASLPLPQYLAFRNGPHPGGSLGEGRGRPRARDFRQRRADVPQHHAGAVGRTAALYGRNGADQSLRRIAHLAGLPEAVDQERRIAVRCRGEGFACGGMAGRAALSATAP